MFDKTLIKIITLSSLIVGAILGLIPLIPAFSWIAFILEMFLVAPFIILYLRKLRLIEINEMDKTLAVGGIAGAVSCFGFAIVFFPIALIIYMIFKTESFLWVKVMISNFGFLLPMILFIALLSALLNMFSGFLLAYFYQFFKGKE